MKKTTRRTFAAALAAAPAVAQQAANPGGAPNPNTSIQQEQQRRFGPPPEVPPFGATIELTRKDVPAKVEPFPLSSIRVLGGVSLGIEPAEFLCVLGPSGCGKTTLLNCIAGFLRPSAGRVLSSGEARRT